MTRILGVLATSMIASGCAQPFDHSFEGEDGPLGCDLPTPCEVVSLPEMSLELEPRSAAECMYDVLVSGEAAHLRMEFITTSESYYDLYIRGDEPPVYVSTRCEYDGPCQEPDAWRCTLDAPEQLDCSNPDGSEDGSARVCGGMVNWCNSMSMIEPTCP